MSKTNSSNQSIDRMFSIVEVMASTARPMRLNEIAEQSGISASTAMRILNALIENGYASQDEETFLYSLSYKFMMIGNSLRENLSINQLMGPYLSELSKRVGLSCAIGIRSGYSLVYINEVISTQQMLRVYHHLGNSNPMYANACGKLFLSRMSKQEFSQYLKQTNLTPFTPKTLISKQALEENLKEIRNQGFAVNDEEGTPGMRCIALPVESSGGELIAGMSISGTIYQITSEAIPLISSTGKDVLQKMYNECEPVLSQISAGELL